MVKEIWKDIKGYKGLYKISNLGRIRSIDRFVSTRLIGFNQFKKGRILKTLKHKEGYLRVDLYKNGSGRKFFIHRLVALSFIENPENKPQINHKNGIKTDNRIENLEWCTHKENCNHAAKNGLFAKGEEIGNSKLTEKQVLEIRGLSKKGLSQRIIASQYGVYQTTVNKIVNHQIWKHI